MRGLIDGGQKGGNEDPEAKLDRLNKPEDVFEVLKRGERRGEKREERGERREMREEEQREEIKT